MQSHHEVLGVHKGANASEVRRAFLALAKAHHPDKSDDPDAAAKFRRVHDAYEALLKTCPRAPAPPPATAKSAEPSARCCTDCGQPSPAGVFGTGIAEDLWFCKPCFAREKARNRESEDFFAEWKKQLAKGGGRRKKGKLAKGGGKGKPAPGAPAPAKLTNEEANEAKKAEKSAEMKKRKEDQELARSILIARRLESDPRLTQKQRDALTRAAVPQQPGPAKRPAENSGDGAPPAAAARMGGAPDQQDSHGEEDPSMLWVRSGAAGLAAAGWQHLESRSNPGNYYFFRAATGSSLPEETDAAARELGRIWGEEGPVGLADRGWERRQSRTVPGSYYYFHPQSSRSLVAAESEPESAPATPPSLRLPEGWERRESRSNPGNFYYYNSRTGVTQMQRPS